MILMLYSLERLARIEQSSNGQGTFTADLIRVLRQLAASVVRPRVAEDVPRKGAMTL